MNGNQLSPNASDVDLAKAEEALDAAVAAHKDDASLDNLTRVKEAQKHLVEIRVAWRTQQGPRLLVATADNEG